MKIACLDLTENPWILRPSYEEYPNSFDFKPANATSWFGDTHNISKFYCEDNVTNLHLHVQINYSSL